MTISVQLVQAIGAQGYQLSFNLIEQLLTAGIEQLREIFTYVMIGPSFGAKRTSCLLPI